MNKKQCKTKRGMSCVMAAAVLSTQLWDCGVMTAWADTMEWEGTTQISTNDQYTDIDTSDISLIVEEVYVEAGGYVQENQNILKFTDESYQDSLDHYAAAIIYAQNDLTSARMDYDIAMREAESALELTKAEAEQAEFTKEQHLKELEDTIKGHEEIQTELEEAIEELEDGIAAGSYASSSSSSGKNSSSGTSSKKKNNSANKKQEKESETEAETESETEKTSESETEEEIFLGPESNPESEPTPDGEQGTNRPGEDGTDWPEGGMQPGGEMKPGTDGETSPEDGNHGQVSDVKNQLENVEIQIKAAEIYVDQLENEIERISGEIEKQNALYDQTLEKIYKKAGSDMEAFCGAGDIFLVNEANGTTNVPPKEEDQNDMIISDEEDLNVDEGEPSAGLVIEEGIKTGASDEVEDLPQETAMEGDSVKKSAPESKEPETKTPETKAPETKTPETKAPETKAPETKAPETKAPETSAPETKAPETSAPESEAEEIIFDNMSDGLPEDTEGTMSGSSSEEKDDSDAEIITETEEFLIEDELTFSSNNEGSGLNDSGQENTGVPGESESEEGASEAESESESESEEETLELLLKTLSQMEGDRAKLYRELSDCVDLLEYACDELEQLEETRVIFLKSNQKEETEDTPETDQNPETEGKPEDGSGMPGDGNGTPGNGIGMPENGTGNQ